MIKMTSDMIFLAVEATPNRFERDKTNYIVAFSSGVDTVRIYIDRAQYEQYSYVDTCTPVRVNFEFNPAATKVSYCLNLIDMIPRTAAPLHPPEKTNQQPEKTKQSA